MKSTIRRIVAACLSTAILAAASMPSMAQNTHSLPLVLPDGGSQAGFVRIVNQSDQAGTVRITAIDDTGRTFGPINLTLDANEAVNFNSRDLESGNARKGLPSGIGDGSGSWRLILETALNITPLAYVRTSDGFVTAMHDIAAATEAGSQRYQILFFNPGSNQNQVSRLRIINTGGTAANIEITALDDPGMSAPGGTISLNVPAGGARTLTAQALETGGSTFSGRLGDGAGKWRLTVSSNVDIQIMNLLATPTGHLANLSTIPGMSVSPGPTVPTGPDVCPAVSVFSAPGNVLEIRVSGRVSRLRWLEGMRYDELTDDEDSGTFTYRRTGPDTAIFLGVTGESEWCDWTLTCTSGTTGPFQGTCIYPGRSPISITGVWTLDTSGASQ